MKRLWRPVLVVVGVLLIVASLYVAPLIDSAQLQSAARSGTRAAITSAQAAQSSKQTEQALHELLVTEQGVQRLLDYVASIQSGPQASAAREATDYYVAILKAICAADHCAAPVPPKGL